MVSSGNPSHAKQEDLLKHVQKKKKKNEKEKKHKGRSTLLSASMQFLLHPTRANLRQVLQRTFAASLFTADGCRSQKPAARSNYIFCFSSKPTTAASARTSKHYVCLSLLLFARRSISPSLAVDLSRSLPPPPPLSLSLSLSLALSLPPSLPRSVPPPPLSLSFSLFLNLAHSLPPLSFARSQLQPALSRGRTIRGSLTLRVSHAIRVSLALRVLLARYSSMSLSLSLSLSGSLSLSLFLSQALSLSLSLSASLSLSLSLSLSRELQLVLPLISVNENKVPVLPASSRCNSMPRSRESSPFFLASHVLVERSLTCKLFLL